MAVTSILKAENLKMMSEKEIKEMFVAKSMREYEKRKMATGLLSTNRMLAEINGAALAHVLREFQKTPMIRKLELALRKAREHNASTSKPTHEALARQLSKTAGKRPIKKKRKFD